MIIVDFFLAFFGILYYGIRRFARHNETVCRNNSLETRERTHKFRLIKDVLEPGSRTKFYRETKECLRSVQDSLKTVYADRYEERFASGLVCKEPYPTTLFTFDGLTSRPFNGNPDSVPANDWSIAYSLWLTSRDVCCCREILIRQTDGYDRDFRIRYAKEMERLVRLRYSDEYYRLVVSPNDSDLLVWAYDRRAAGLGGFTRLWED